MAKTVGVLISDRIELALVEDGKMIAPLQKYPLDATEDDALVEKPLENLIDLFCQQIEILTATAKNIAAVGVALPGLVLNGVVEESPNLPQLKGAKVKLNLEEALRQHGLNVPVKVLNDADAVAAGFAARMGKLDSYIRVWSLGTGIGYGRYPFADGVWEGGHMVVSLDDTEQYCGCGGRGHLEGIMGHRAMRLRFLDMEPEEVFEAAARGDERCRLFKRLWHKALAAATASSVHMSGAGKFYLTGYNIRFVDLNLLHNYMLQMVRMSSLRGFSIELVPDYEGAAAWGAGIVAQGALGA